MRRISISMLGVGLALLFSLYTLSTTARAQAPAIEQTTTARAPVGSGFTYQGRLTFGGAPAVGEYDFQTRLYDGSDAGISTQVGDTETREDVTVTDGTFTVYLDFGSAAFDGEGRWLEIAVRPSEQTDSASYNTLSPRQPLTPTPYALHAAEAGTAATAPWSGLTGVPGTLSFLAAPSPCASGQVPKWDGSAWACAADENSGGDITGVAAGTGLSGGGTSGDVTVSADTGYLQRRVSTDCATGSSIRSIAEDGTVTCETDDTGPDPQQVVWVATSGGDFTSVQTALDSITDASADKPYLIRIAPGIYTEQVTLKEHVALEGAGEGKTILRWTGSNTSPDDSGESVTVRGANNTELRLLTIESVAGGHQYAVALQNSNTSPTLIHVTVTASGGAFNNIGVYNNASSLTMDNVTVTASGGAFSYGVYNVSSTARMTNVTATASGGNQENFGVINVSSSPTMDNVTATASGGRFNYGVYNNSSSPKMTNVTAIASGGSQENNGVYNISSSPTLDNVTATASGGSGDNYGVSNIGSSPTIRDSTLTGSTYSVFRGGGAVRVANSQLVGPLSSSLICFNNYNASLAPVTCS